MGKTHDRLSAMAKMFGKEDDEKTKKKAPNKDEGKRALVENDEHDDEGTEETISPQLGASLATADTDHDIQDEPDDDVDDKPLKHKLFGGKNIHIIIAMSKKHHKE